MIVTVKLYLPGKVLSGKESYPVELFQGATVGDLARSISKQLGNLTIDEKTLFMINQRAVNQDKILCDGDCILVLKPLVGG
ncbi:MAG: MoaD/ThiS family protein [Proteobacteria bacterium]|nr:MoaD/ThiS family protein [Pseudomonadota bacterium]MBU4010252.1 MoaD/ThiS family protein [Pseudomonadota bacterium]MBU4035744.1 MoaD/ThiS family protein [Pseudomonadota bacterium]